MGGARGAFDDVLELVGEQLVAEVGGLRQGGVQPANVIEPVAVHQPFQLVDEDGVERRAEDPPVDVLFGQAADPQVDLLEALVASAHEGAVAHGRGGRRNVAVEGVGGDEVHQRLRVDHVRGEVVPARVGRQVAADRVVGGLRPHIEGRAGLVQGRQADVATAGDVDRGQVHRLAEQALLQGRGDELVGLVAQLMAHAQGDRRGAGFGELLGAEEGFRQGVLENLAGDAASGIDGVDGLAQLRVAEAEGGLRVLHRDRGVFRGVIGLEVRKVGGHRAGVLVHRDVLILHLVHQLGGFEHLVLVPRDVPVAVDVVAE